MKVLKILGIIAFIIVVVAITIVLRQPSSVHLEKSIVINGSSQAIAEHVESFQSSDAWSPWNKVSPETKYTIVVFEGFSGTFYTDLKMEPEENGTRVTWIYDGNNDTFKEKANWFLMKGNLNRQYDEGLKALKEIVESKSSELVPADSLSNE